VRVLVYGDFVIDKYTRVSVTRQCPEAADAPVCDIGETIFQRLGCAGNTLQNVVAIAKDSGDPVDIWYGGISGFHPPFTTLKLCTSSNLMKIDANYIIKERLVTQDDEIVCRLDNRRTFSVSAPLITPCPEFDLVIISDYGFGAVTAEVAAKLLAIGKISIVDSKREDLTIFRGATVFKLNEHEYSRQVARMATTDDRCVEALCHYCIVSLGDRGCVVKHFEGQGKSYRIDSAHHRSFPADAEVDVTGCGDTFTAALGLRLCEVPEIHSAARYANYLASRVVSHMGPAVPSETELKTAKGI